MNGNLVNCQKTFNNNNNIIGKPVKPHETMNKLKDTVLLVNIYCNVLQ